MPQTGGRVLVASDGVWDAFAKPERVARMSRAWHTEVLPPVLDSDRLAGRQWVQWGARSGDVPAYSPVFGACGLLDWVN